MLPVVRGEQETAGQIVLYSLVMVAFTVFVGIWLGPLYTVAAIVLGAVFMRSRCSFARPLTARAKVLFHYSLLYLALLFTAAALDPVLL
jgi:protoheme IX farnesyltransferase